MISPFLLDKLKMNDKVGPAAAYIAFKLRIAVHCLLTSISVRSFIKKFGAKQNIIPYVFYYARKCNLKMDLWSHHQSYHEQYRPELLEESVEEKIQVYRDIELLSFLAFFVFEVA